MKSCLFFILLLYTAVGFSQTKLVKTSEISQIIKNYEHGVLLINDDQIEEAYTYINRGISSSKSINNDSLIAFGNLHLSKCYLSQNKYLESIDSANEALQMFKILNNKLEISNCNFQLGTIHGKISNFDEGLTYYFKALKIKEEIQDDVGVAFILNKIGNIYLYLPNLKQAEINYKRALVLNLKHDHHLGITFNSTNIGVIYQKNKEYDKAIAQFKSVLAKTEEYNIAKLYQAVLYGNIGSTLTSQKKYTEALENLSKALALKEDVGNDGRTAHTCNDIAFTYLQMKQYAKAKEFALKAISYSQNENLFQHRKGYQLLSECDYALGDFEASYRNLKQYDKLKDSILSIQRIANIDENQIKYETEKRDLKIQAQESDIALLNEKNKVKNQYMAFGTAGLLFLFGFILLIRSKNKQKQRQQLQEQFSRDLMNSQEDERTRIAKELHDSVGQQLTLIKKKSQNAKQDDITNLANNTLEEVRSISRGLYPAMLKQLGLKESIEQLVYEYDEESDLFFTSEIDDIDNLLDDVESLNFYRFIQECLTNIIKHAEAKTVSLSIKKENKSIITILNDNGKGFDTSAKQNQNSLGLKTIAERISIFKGKLSIESKAGKGTEIFALIPITI